MINTIHTTNNNLATGDYDISNTYVEFYKEIYANQTKREQEHMASIPQSAL